MKSENKTIDTLEYEKINEKDVPKNVFFHLWIELNSMMINLEFFYESKKDIQFCKWNNMKKLRDFIRLINLSTQK